MRFARVFAISIAFLLLFLLNTTPGHASTTPRHCAQPVPPSVSGSPGPAPATPGIVLINEVLNNPGSNWNCSEAANTYSLMTDAWVELYNPQNQPFNLYAAHTSLDAGPNTFTFHFPFGAAIAARGYLVVFPDTYAGMLNAGNNLRLTIGGSEIDQTSIPALAPDTSYARIPDGSANWTKLQLPATTDSSTTPAATTPLVTSPTASSASSAWDVPRRILLTVLVVALALSLFWCWKVFSSR